ncbi:MAG TPA: DUF6089 family protein, partial [Phaeodactylibacter sp.]|nr:DUF6089 family protein [Phaeodactylibacter sp.]
MKKWIATVLALTLWCLPFALGQRSTEAGLFLGVSNYMGDLSPTPIAANETQFAFGGHYRYMLNDKLGLKASVAFAKISGADVNKPVVNPNPNPRRFSMEAGLLEFAIQGEWHPLATPRFDNAGLYTRQCSPYVGFGLGLIFAEAEVQAGNNSKVQFPEPDDASAFIALPMTLGMRFDIGEYLILSGEFGLRVTFSDYLDGVSQNGNPETNDHYFMGGISVLYL